LNVKPLLSLCAIACCAWSTSTWAAKSEILLRHQLNGPAAELLTQFAARFNLEEKSGVLRIESARLDNASKQPPHLVLSGEEGLTPLLNRRDIRPLHQFMAENGGQLNPEKFYPALRDAADDAGGRLQSLPLAYSLPVLFYNKDAFRRVGLDPEQPPKTWWEVQKAAGALYDSGMGCPYTSSQAPWLHLENVSTQHNEPFLTANAKGATRFSFNSMVHIKHIALLSSWVKSKYFHYFGRDDVADAKFAAAECAMLTSDSASYAALVRSANFQVGVGELPYYDDAYRSVQQNIVPAGAALWAVAGHQSTENRVAARFITFLLRANIQQEWVKTSGFLPMTADAGITTIVGLNKPVVAALSPRFTERRQFAALNLRSPDSLGGLRKIVNEELEAVWANLKPAKEALDTAVRRSNQSILDAKLR